MYLGWRCPPIMSILSLMARVALSSSGTSIQGNASRTVHTVTRVLSTHSRSHLMAPRSSLHLRTEPSEFGIQTSSPGPHQCEFCNGTGGSWTSKIIAYCGFPPITTLRCSTMLLIETCWVVHFRLEWNFRMRLAKVAGSTGLSSHVPGSIFVADSIS